uniref:Growth arrest-specific 1b n=1 Tax=Fundulus heteroclitus TaxID=8078 RepID=A0A3Q2PVZ7_FUNHE
TPIGSCFDSSLISLIAIGFCGGSPNHNRRPVCWKAILKCHGEPECRYAYDQYLNACASVISGGGRMCPSHCISSLIQLNLTRNGPDLEDCDCATDPVCRSTQQAIDPCVPRTSTMGCTEARLQCETDRACSSAMRDYLFHCRKLFGRQKCSESCRKTIANMRSIPKAQQLDACICDGSERNICEYIKLSMKTLCSDSSDRFVGNDAFPTFCCMLKKSCTVWQCAFVFTYEESMCCLQVPKVPE